MDQPGQEDKSNYDKHKKYHDMFVKYTKMIDDKHIRGLTAHVGKVVNKFFQENEKEGSVDLSKMDDKKLKEFTDNVYKTAKDYVLKKYHKFSDEDIEKLEKQKTTDGDSVLEHLVDKALQGFTKEELFNAFRGKGLMRADKLYEDFISVLPSAHQQHRISHYLGKQITTLDDMMGVEKYISMAKDHNPESLEGVRKTKFTSIDDARRGFQDAAMHINKTYHPDKQATYK
ncbi:MAG: hypothetical protein V1866_03940 [archaeon]